MKTIIPANYADQVYALAQAIHDLPEFLREMLADALPLVENRVNELGIPSLFDAVLKEESDGVIYYRQEGVLQSWRNGGD